MYVINIEVDLQGVLLKFPVVFAKFSGQVANAVTYTGQGSWFAPCHCNNLSVVLLECYTLGLI